MKFILKLLVSALAVWLTCWFLDNVTCSPWYYSLVVAIAFALMFHPKNQEAEVVEEK